METEKTFNNKIISKLFQGAEMSIKRNGCWFKVQET